MVYTFVPIPKHIDVLKFMGRGGRHLKNITERTETQYIWVDMTQRIVEIWGLESKLAGAIAAVKGRLRRLTDIWVPETYHSLRDRELKTSIDVACWEIGFRTFYDVVGSEENSKRFFDELCKQYPFNPYMTQIEKRSPTGLLIARFSSCD